MIRKITYGFLLLAASVLLFSCEEVIEIDLNSAHPALVVEAQLYEDSLIRVHLTKTANYFSTDAPVPIEDATVNLASDNSESEELLYTGNGFYIGQRIIGKSGHNYTLDIEWEGETYRGSASLQKSPEIIALNPLVFQPAPQAPILNQVELVFLDDPETENFYLLRYAYNDTLINDFYFALNDQISLADTITFTNPAIYFNTGDRVDVQVFSIDQDLFLFYSQLNDALSGSMAMSSTPYNPTSNIEGAMGYFAAWSYDSMSVIIPDLPSFP